MGGSQSQASSDKDLASYDSHEKVLTDAQASLSSPDIITADSINGAEEYYSAEEGNSISSLTPERTRPESSSAENSSGSSDDDTDDDKDDYSTEDSCETEPHSTSSSVSQDTCHISDVDVDVTSGQSYDQYTVQEHSSFGPELENINRSCNIFVSASDKTRLNQDNKSIIILKEPGLQILNFENPSEKQVTLIHPLQELNVDTASEWKEHLITSNNTAHISSESQIGESVTSVHKIYTSGSLKHRGNGYIESSESDSDELEKYIKRKPRKKRKMSSESQSRSRHRYQYSKNRKGSVSIFDERSFGKRKCEVRLCRCDS